jgi:hypothetical protein
MAALVPAISNLLTEGGQKVIAATGMISSSGPIAWTVTMSQGTLNYCHAWTFPKPISAVPYYNVGTTDMNGDDRWALGQGGVEKDTIAYTVTVQGTGAGQVVLRDLRLAVLGKAPVLHGVTVMNAPGCQGGTSDRYYEVDLGKPAPRFQLLTPGASSAVPIDQAYTVSQSDTETFVIRVIDSSPQQLLFTYKIQLDWSQGTATGTADILSPVGNKPFQLNGTAYSHTDPRYNALNGSWQPG